MQGSTAGKSTSEERAAKRELRRSGARLRQKKARRLVIIAGALSFIVTLLVVHFTKILEPAQVFTPPRQTLPPVAPTPSPTPTPHADARPVFRYSVVPGGVRTADEVVRAMERDPVVAGHYAKVVPALLRSETLTSPLTVHVSYRVDDQIFWTKKTFTLSAGEKVLTDGKTTLRERCGNMLSLDPLTPALEAEPAPPEFDLRVDPFAPTGGVGALGPPPPPSGLPPGTPRFSLFSLAPPPPTVVPEPSTWLLVATGLGFGAARLLRRK